MNDLTPNIHSMTTQKLEAHAAKVSSVKPDPRRFEIEDAIWPEYKEISKARGKKRQALKDEFSAQVNARLAELDDYLDQEGFTVISFHAGDAGYSDGPPKTSQNEWDDDGIIFPF